MKNQQKGLIIGIIALVVIVGGIYIYTNKKAEVPVPVSPIVQNQNPAPVTPANPQNPPVVNPSTPAPSPITSDTLQRYTDTTFGFSFWYPKIWSVTKLAPTPNADGNIWTGKVLATLIIGPKDNTGTVQPLVSLQEVQSPTFAITDHFGTDANPTYFFNPSAHAWMTVKDVYNLDAQGRGYYTKATTTADVSTNTMGGLHMLGASNQYRGGLIIPLSAENFVVVNTISAFDSQLLAKTITATDSSVATSLSVAEQTKTVQNEATAYLGAPATIVWKTYTDPQLRFSFRYPTSFAGGADLFPDNAPRVFVTATTTNIDASGCYKNLDMPVSHADQQVTVNNIPFCLSGGGEAGMSQLYTSYNYTTHRNGLYITLSYTTHTSNGCGIIQGDPPYLSCDYFFKHEDIIVQQPIRQSVGSLVFQN